VNRLDLRVTLQVAEVAFDDLDCFAVPGRHVKRPLDHQDSGHTGHQHRPHQRGELHRVATVTIENRRQRFALLLAKTLSVVSDLGLQRFAVVGQRNELHGDRGGGGIGADEQLAAFPFNPKGALPPSAAAFQGHVDRLGPLRAKALEQLRALGKEQGVDVDAVPPARTVDILAMRRKGLEDASALLRAEGGAERPRVLLGMDTRESSGHLAGRLARGVKEAGADVASAGVISTPGVACLVRENHFSAGVVVSASHNPYTDNGIKLISSQGTKFSDVVEAALERDILRRRETAHGVADALVPADAALDAQYLEYLRRFVLPGARLEGMRLALDCANGAVSELGPALFRSLGAEVTAIHNGPNGININAPKS